MVASKTSKITMSNGEILAFPLRMRRKQSSPGMLLLWNVLKMLASAVKSEK